MKINLRLERAVNNYCGWLRNSHKKQRRYVIADGKKKHFWDLPFIAVACQGTTKSIFKDHSKPVRADTYDSTPILKAELLKCAPRNGKIGDTTILPECGNQVGRCAEPHAAKKCISDKSASTLDQIKFSIAHKVRGGEPKSPCAICKHVFPSLK